MAFKKAHKGAGTKSKAVLLEEGAYPARLVRLIDLGFQKATVLGQNDCFKMTFTFELLDEYMKGEDGEELLDKPRWFDIDLMYNEDGYMHENSNMFKFMGVLDSEGEKDLIDLLGTPVQLMIVVYKKAKGKAAGESANKIGGIIKMKSKDIEGAPALKNPTVFFSMDEPDLAVFNALPKGNEYMPQNRILASMKFNGSPLQKLLGITPTTEAEQAPEEDEPLDEDLGAPLGDNVAPADAEPEVDLFQ